MRSQDRQQKETAELLCHRLPNPIRTRVLDDDTFWGQFGPPGGAVVTIAGCPIDQGALFQTARETWADRRERRLVDRHGRNLRMVLEDGEVILRDIPERAEHPDWVRLPYLAVFSPDSSKRLAAVDNVQDAVGPTVDLATLRTAAAARELADHDAAALVGELAGGVEAIHRRIAEAFRTGKTGRPALIPDRLAYYEKLCGPAPDATPPEDYLRVDLPLYRRKLLRRDLARGLEICLLGALRNDQCPGQWVEDVPDDLLWDALTLCSPTDDPFSLLGALDVALYRHHDKRFRDLARNATARLLQDTFPRPDGIDTYEFLPLLAELTLNHLNTREDWATRRPPFWKRLCAWMHAGFLARVTLDYVVKLDTFRDWADSCMRPAGQYAQLLDLRREPMLWAAGMTRLSLRHEIVGRLTMLRTHHGDRMPMTGEIDQVLTAGARPFCFMPGPLDGHLRPRQMGGRLVSADDASAFAAELGEDPLGVFFPGWAHGAQLFDLGEEVLARIRFVSEGLRFPEDKEARKKLVSLLAYACAISAAHPDIDLARLLGAKIVLWAPEMRTAAGAIAGLRILIMAGAAFEDDRQWASWLEEQLAEYAARLPAGEVSRVFLAHLGELKTVLDLTLGIHCRAEAFASAAS
ncbi:MAG: hypothetical protein AB1634_06710 [Thermodesulfobacteriota bacterium]